MAGPDLTPNELRRLVIKGRDLYKGLRQGVAQHGNTFVQLLEIAPGYQTRLDPPEMPGIVGVGVLLDNANQPTDRYVLV